MSSTPWIFLYMALGEHIYSFGQIISGDGIAESESGLLISPIRNCQMIFKWLCHRHSISTVWEIRGSHPLQYLVLLVFLILAIPVGVWEYRSLICISLYGCIEPLYIWLLASSISYFVDISIPRILFLLVIGLFVLLMVSSGWKENLNFNAVHFFKVFFNVSAFCVLFKKSLFWGHEGSHLRFLLKDVLFYLLYLDIQSVTNWLPCVVWVRVCFF